VDDATPRKSELQDLEGPRLDDPLYEENAKPLMPGTDPEDGLPRMIPMTKLEDAESVPLTPKSFVCMAHKEEVDGQLMELRPKCEHYVRQLIPWKDDPDHMFCRRTCTAMKNEEGEYISLNDQAIYACELRTPRDPSSEEALDVFDAKIMAKQKQQDQEEELFDPTTEIGIFR